MKVFKDNKEFAEIYDKSLDNYPMLSNKAKNLRNKADDLMEEYFDALERYAFRYGYECGYKAAMTEMKKGGTA